MLIITLCLLGLCAGRLVALAVERLPCAIAEDQDAVLALCYTPRACRSGLHRLSWRDRIPLFGFACARGHCRHCGQALGLRTPLLELGTALTFALLACDEQHTVQLVMQLILFSWLLALVLIDWQHLLLPDALTLSLLWLGLLFNLFSGHVPLADCVLGATASYCALWLLATGYGWWCQQEALGLGDAKLLAALGAWLGWTALPGLLLLACLLTLCAAVARRLVLKTPFSQPMPFGPGLALAGFGLTLHLF